MKKIILLLFLGFSLVYGQDFEMSAKNGNQIDSQTFEFDVFIKALTSDFLLGSYAGALSFNSAIANGGTLTFSYIASSSALGNPPNTGVDIKDDGGSSELTFGASVGSDNISSTDIKVGTFRITNTVPFASQQPNIDWNDDGTFFTIIYTNTFADITANGLYTPLDYASPLPVELSSFSVNSLEGTKAQLEWETATEVNNFGFEIERSLVVENAEEDESVETTWEKVSFVEGHGNSNSPKVYTFTDKSLVGGSKFAYRLKQIDIDGKFEYSDIIEIEVLPNRYALEQNYPNPFNPSTTIKFSLPEDVKLAINIYNVLGEKVATVLNKELKAGFHQVNFNTTSAGYKLASGVYIYTLESKNFSQVKKMILMK